MREIKFRAYHGEAGTDKMKYNVGVHPFMIFRLSSSGISDPEDVYDDNTGDLIVTTGCYNVMQFTGLKDKNGKEIYEGDILRTHFDNTDQYLAYDEVGSVVFSSLSWKIEDIKHGNYYNFYTHTEIIGNIYENPNLLT